MEYGVGVVMGLGLQALRHLRLDSTAAVGRPCQCQEEEAGLGDVHRDRRQTGSQEIGPPFSS